MQPVGLYIHVPFCSGKCPYCDFFSLRGDDRTMNLYTNRIIEEIKKYKLEYPDMTADTLYFGGGTPSLLGAERLCRILTAARQAFGLENAEITLEANPDGELQPLFEQVHAAGVNRVSLGLQSADERELRLLGRQHTAQDAARAVEDAHRAGIANVSLDLMLAVPGQTAETLQKSVQFCLQAGVTHLSMYLLRIEPHTAYWQRREQMDLPDDDKAAELYEKACSLAEKGGLRQYEISNFARPGQESRHNLKYWDLAPYLGLGPAAHSYFGGKRFYWPRSLRGFLAGEAPLPEEDAEIPAGSFAEYAMLRLRLTAGLREADCRKRFGHGIPDAMRRTAQRYVPAGLTQVSPESLRLTRRGFLVSNPLLADLLEEL
ncbi:radical SAM family heme chaperone HemW [Caproicibacterium lactatifermentans]|jgi:oxygen-independent coproporphyrinogen-3 oxidase|uniref:Heme chaperone HemW n=1 Tax=Caproicibacterium lactatifermentans TaxID=2666138 RepID=A0A859DQP0_9FIRM|nr:radical SAM family heme chaperone HemW [Caproicibacterium lactatifermentans]ARP49514.1 coproporphyrinogen III oxidase [Ruminococcaceae bacterium CPB6]MDD4806913.1 radical SAM family heme chaperone HemW [Oscillospiraceae bacterium]QKN23102.1 radical SAM family heme chaperone HemW [Caproicibacterium lactatifermentans]QKO30292.1 radical SAM family heme chaperone HemW [Caproicibacterium lactatifermentans]